MFEELSSLQAEDDVDPDWNKMSDFNPDNMKKERGHRVGNRNIQLGKNNSAK